MSEIANNKFHSYVFVIIAELQQDINESLWLLLESRAHITPTFDFEKDTHRKFKSRPALAKCVAARQL